MYIKWQLVKQKKFLFCLKKWGRVVWDILVSAMILVLIHRLLSVANDENI